MSGWEVGDLALCVKCIAAPGMIGSVSRVTAISYPPNGISWPSGTPLGLHLKEFPKGNDFGWASQNFRKIKPDTEPCEEEFTVLIKRGRKVSA